MSAESRLPDYAATARTGRVPPGVYRLEDQPGNASVRVVDTDNIPDYDVVASTELLKEDNPTLARRFGRARRLFAVVDPAVHQIYGQAIEAYLGRCGIPFTAYILPNRTNSEGNKSAETWMALHAWLMEQNIGGSDLLVGFGGGVTSDLVGFTASSTRRGIPYLFVTTTLTAAIDAGISPKTAINVGHHKNSCGTIYPPECVLSDTTFLTTDPSMKTGLAELTKLSIVRCEELFSLLEREGTALLRNRFQDTTGRKLIELAQHLFLRMKFEPPFPGNRPASLRSFGHAFSRRLESLSGFTLTHGEAIAVEMAIAASLACELRGFPEAQKDRIVALLDKFQLLSYCPECNANEIWPVFKAKVDANEPLWFPIPDGRIGQGSFLRCVSKSELARAMDSISQIRSREATARSVLTTAKVMACGTRRKVFTGTKRHSDAARRYSNLSATGSPKLHHAEGMPS